MGESLCAESPFCCKVLPQIYWKEAEHTEGQLRTHLGTGARVQVHSSNPDSPVLRSERNYKPICICISTSDQQLIHIFVLENC